MAAYPRTVTASLYDFDGVTLIDDLDNAFGIVFMDELSGPGSGACSLPLSDANAGDMIAGRVIGIKIEGTRRFSFRIEGNPRYVQVEEGEEEQHILVASGRGWGACVFDDSIIYPEFDLSLPLDSSWRLFSFASPSFPNGSLWPVSTELYEYHDGVVEGLRYVAIEQTITTIVEDGPDLTEDVINYYPSPVGFPWPNSPKNGNGLEPTPTYIGVNWIWPSEAAEDDVGYAFFRDTFTLETDQPVTFSVTADNLFTLFLEGVPILGESDDNLMWLGYKEVTIWLPGGTYQVAAVVQNIDAPTLAYNPGGFLYAAYVSASDVGGETVAWVHAQVSNAEWTSHFSATTWPGWTPGQIIQQYASEAIARGGLNLYAYSETFDGLVDTDNNDWDSIDTETSSIYIPSFAIEVGKTGLDLLAQLHEEGWIDWHFQPATLTLDVWAAGQVGTTPGVTLTYGTNLSGLQRGETAPYANALLVQWSGGFVEVTDAAEVTAFGNRVEDIYSTDAESVADAERLGRIELMRRAVSSRAAVIARIEPTSTTDCPYEGIELGDYVATPNEDFDGTTNQQILSISMQQDEDGFAVWTTELGRRWRRKTVEDTLLLRDLGGKTLGNARDHGVVD